MKNLIIVLIFQTHHLYGQTYRAYRQAFSMQIIEILNKFDSLMCNDTQTKCEGIVQSKLIGEGGTISKIYLQYAELVKVATEKELLTILDNPKEVSAIRGYALMAYVYKCEKDGKMEKMFNYKFKVNMQVGCIGGTYAFAEFDRKIRVRNLYDPTPRYLVRDTNEAEVIKKENEIREEQGIPLRKD